jgi:hypothetical protein
MRLHRIRAEQFHYGKPYDLLTNATAQAVCVGESLPSEDPCLADLCLIHLDDRGVRETFQSNHHQLQPGELDCRQSLGRDETRRLTGWQTPLTRIENCSATSRRERAKTPLGVRQDAAPLYDLGVITPDKHERVGRELPLVAELPTYYSTKPDLTEIRSVRARIQLKCWY